MQMIIEVFVSQTTSLYKHSTADISIQNDVSKHVALCARSISTELAVGTVER